MSIIIALEGIDGSGKTLQLQLLEDALHAAGKTVERRDYPVYSSKFGLQIGEMLSGKGQINANTVDPLSMALWFAMDRYEDLRINPLSNADYCIINRYVLSNMVYQSQRASDAEFVRKWIFELEHKTLGLPIPDAYIFFDVDTVNAGANVLKKGYRDYVGDNKDVYEQSQTTQQAARAGYLECAKHYSNVLVIPCVDNNTLANAQVISKRVLEALHTRGLV